MTSAHLLALSFILRLPLLWDRQKAKEKDGCCLTPFLFLFLSFNWKTQGAPSIPNYKQQKKKSHFFLLFVVHFSPLVCWINHFTPVINKQTNGWMSLPSDY